MYASCAYLCIFDYLLKICCLLLLILYDDYVVQVANELICHLVCKLYE